LQCAKSSNLIETVDDNCSDDYALAIIRLAGRKKRLCLERIN